MIFSPFPSPPAGTGSQETLSAAGPLPPEEGREEKEEGRRKRGEGRRRREERVRWKRGR